jgi:cytochrome oxidase assembly protein ShyY1
MYISSNGQTRIDYLIGLRTGDIGDYSQPSERLYTQIFNQSGLPTLVYTRYIPQMASDMPLNSDQPLDAPFYYRTGPYYGVSHGLHTYMMKNRHVRLQLDWWIILVLVVGIFTILLILFLICYLCCRRR